MRVVCDILGKGIYLLHVRWLVQRCDGVARATDRFRGGGDKMILDWCSGPTSLWSECGGVKLSTGGVFSNPSQVLRAPWNHALRMSFLDILYAC